MSSWLRKQWCVFDLETTGVDVYEDRIVSFAVGRVGGGQGTAMLTGLINPGIPIPEGATAIHRITDDMVQGAPLARDGVEHIAVQLVSAQLSGLPIVSYNLNYDLTLLAAELDRYGLPTLQSRLNRPIGPVLDGFVLDKHTDPWRKGSRKLIDVAAHYGCPLDELDAHGAEADALAAARVVWKIGMKDTSIGRLPLDELHTAQAAWKAEQDASFRAYLERQGKDADGLDGHWPIRLRGQVAA
jgi:DNA polymerase-3 subunit epsilon